MERERFKGDFIIISSHRFFHRGTHDYERDERYIREIRLPVGEPIQPVWAETWTALAEGVLSRREPISGQEMIQIFRGACPVRIRFERWYEHASYDGYELPTTQSDSYWVQYEAVF